VFAKFQVFPSGFDLIVEGLLVDLFNNYIPQLFVADRAGERRIVVSEQYLVFHQCQVLFVVVGMLVFLLLHIVFQVFILLNRWIHVLFIVFVKVFSVPFFGGGFINLKNGLIRYNLLRIKNQRIFSLNAKSNEIVTSVQVFLQEDFGNLAFIRSRLYNLIQLIVRHLLMLVLAFAVDFVKPLLSRLRIFIIIVVIGMFVMICFIMRVAIRLDVVGIPSL